jgi:hypothetical protein
LKYHGKFKDLGLVGMNPIITNQCLGPVTSHFLLEKDLVFHHEIKTAMIDIVACMWQLSVDWLQARSMQNITATTNH